MFRTLLLTAGAVAALAVAVATPAEAWPRQRHAAGAFHTQRGGFTGQADVRRSRGERVRDATLTGPNGRQTSVHDDRQWNRQHGTYDHDRTRTFANGDTRSVDTDVQRTGPGAYSAEREVTGRNGETRTQTGDFTVTHNDNGRTINGQIDTSNAAQIDYNRNVTHHDGVRSVNSTATFEDGSTIHRDSSASCAGAGSCQSSGAVTNRQGATTTWDNSRQRTEDGAVRTHDVTFADGTTRAVETDRVGNGDGTGDITRTVTGRDGETRTQTGTYSVTH